MERMNTEGRYDRNYMYTFGETVLPGVSRPYVGEYPANTHHTQEHIGPGHREPYRDKEHMPSSAPENVAAFNTGSTDVGEACKTDVNKVLELFPFVCGLCYRQFNKVNCYFEHLASHSECKDDFFHICFDESQKKDGDEAKLFFCGLCDTVFPTVCLLHDHMLSTENVNKYIFDKSTNRTQSVDLETGGTRPSLISSFQEASDPQEIPIKEEIITEIVEPVEASVAIESVSTACESSLNEDSHTVDTDSSATDINTEPPSPIQPPKPAKKTIPPLRIRTTALLKKQPRGRPPKKRGRKKKSETILKEPKRKYKLKIKVAKEKKTKPKPKKESTSCVPDASTETKTATTDSPTEGFDESLPPVKKKRVFKGIRSSMPWWQVPVPCQICGLMYTKASLKRHEELHADVIKKDFKCDICGKAFRRKAELRIHEAVHSDVADFVCDLCGKAFKLLEAMKAHRKRHTFERNISCPMCPAMFKCKRTLKAHITRHSDYKPFVCQVCGQSFRRRDGLARHKYMHTDYRPFLCPTCNKGFKTKSNLRIHEKVHKPYEYFCPYCNKGFSCNANRKSHMKTHLKDLQHSTEAAPPPVAPQHAIPRMHGAPTTVNPYNPEFNKLNHPEFKPTSHSEFKPSHSEFKPTHSEFKPTHPELPQHSEFKPSHQ